jgi:PTH1 family peptidyl-tRNA hydrolase
LAEFWEKLRERYQSARVAAFRKKAERDNMAQNAAMAMEHSLWLIAGLGNFGPEYAETRHNCGFRALDRLAEILSKETEVSAPKHKFKGIVREARYGDSKLLLLWPMTYMNNSGQSIDEAMQWYGLDEDRLIVLYDDSDIDPGMIRLRAKGSAGSHNGMKSVIREIETDEFARIRIGIGKKPENYDMVDFVLGKVPESDKEAISDAEKRAAEAALSVVLNGCERTMSAYNSARKKEKQEPEGGEETET